SLFLSVCLIFSSISFAFASINAQDYIGDKTMAERQLTITQAPSLNCNSGIICTKEGDIIWSRNASDKHSIASITKVMTAVVVLENVDDLSQTYEVSKTAATIGESSAELKAGSRVAVWDLLCGLLVLSGNDCAQVLAEGLCSSVDLFVEKMNDKAADLNMQTTHYTNPHGLDTDNQYSSAQDLTILIRYAMQDDNFRKIVSFRQVDCNFGGVTRTLYSTNSLLNTWDACLGIKTGYTNKAGYCLASAAVNDGQEYYAVCLGCTDESARFTDSYVLYQWAFSHYRRISLASADEVLVKAPLSSYTNLTIDAGVEQDCDGFIFDYDGDVESSVTVFDLSGPVSIGQNIGSITWKQSGRIVKSEKLVAKQDHFGTLAITSIITNFARIVGIFTGDRAIADTVVYNQHITVTRKDDLSGQEIPQDVQNSISSDINSHR
ncbi:MAG: D-alanyl-D-alanine carboxypeptidase, partial [Coriobacteriales bacterium]|nr:D-alanyl-D-alanine carboxypeptidase [Coriobacteriales bacterium]